MKKEQIPSTMDKLSNKLLNMDEFLLNESLNQFIEEKLKYTSKSDYIYNKKLPKNLEGLEKDELIHLVKQLYADHYKVCRENEQFRTKNFKQYIQLKKLKIEN